MSKETKKTKLGTEPYKGVRDFYPADMAVQNYIFGVMRKTAESFGYSEYEASVLEPAELYRAKSGDEIVNEQTYTFKDRGEREVTLRPEMTPTVARMVAQKQRELAFPLRWFSIPNLFRYERQQRGRLREHWQLNADLFGVNSLEADLEIITMASSLMTNFGATEKDFKILINNRGNIRMILEESGVFKDVEQISKYLSLLDKKKKIGEDKFKAEIIKEFGKEISYDTKKVDNYSQKIIGELAKRGIKNVEFDSELVRGFDYYTGIVFEVYDTNEANNRSLFGGGRYDNLTAIFGGESVPAVGFGMGDVTIHDFLETHNLLPISKSATQLYICTIGEVSEYANELADKLRKENINVAINITDKKIGDQIKYADKNKIPFITVIGEEETKTKILKIKNLASGEEKSLEESEIGKFLSK